MHDIKKFEKNSQEDQKKSNSLKGEIAKRDQNIAVLLEEIKVLRKLSKMPTENQIAREVARRELAMQEKQSSTKRRYETPKKVRAKKQVHFQESEEEEGNSGERSGEELMRCVVKRKKKSRIAVKESEVITEESSSDEDENPPSKKKVSDYIKTKLK